MPVVIIFFGEMVNSLLNRLLLLHDGEYATLKQWDQIGGRVKKGAKAEVVVFWKLQDKEERDDNGDIIIRKIPILRYYNVFHISQVENVFPLIKTADFDTREEQRKNAPGAPIVQKGGNNVDGS